MTDKTWTQLENDLTEAFRKWKYVTSWEWSLGFQYETRRELYKFGKQHSADRNWRRVSLAFDWRSPTDMNTRHVKIEASQADRPIDNLARLVQLVEDLRLADYRSIAGLHAQAYRQMFPVASGPTLDDLQRATGNMTQPALSKALREAYNALYVTPDAPLDVCEAAYRKLATLAHTDVGGSLVRMKKLNVAIETIRESRGVKKNTPMDEFPLSS